MQPEPQDTSLPYWTIDMAARHFGFSRKTVLRYVREGLQTYPSVDGDRLVIPDEIGAEWAQRQQRQRDTRATA